MALAKLRAAQAVAVEVAVTAAVARVATEPPRLQPVHPLQFNGSMHAFPLTFVNRSRHTSIKLMNNEAGKRIDTTPQRVTTALGTQLFWLCLVLAFGCLGWQLTVQPKATDLPWLRWSVGLVPWAMALGALALLGDTLYRAISRKSAHQPSDVPPPSLLEDLRLTTGSAPMFGMPWSMHIQARMPPAVPGSNDAGARPWLRVALVCTHQPLQALQALPSNSVVCSALLVCTPSGAASRGEVSGETDLLLAQQWPTGATDHWHVVIQDANLPEHSPPLLIRAMARPDDRVPLHPDWQPDSLTQLEALLSGNEYDLLERAYSASFHALRGADFCVDALTDAERLAVIQVSFDELLDHALASQWATQFVNDERASSVYLLHEDAQYKVICLERDGDDEMFVSTELRPSLAHYLASARNFFTPMPGLAALKQR